MKKYRFFALFLAMTLLLPACGAKMPEDDLAWYPEELAGQLVYRLDQQNRQPGKALSSRVTYEDEAGARQKAAWGGADSEITIEPVSQTDSSGEDGSRMPENGVKVSDLPAMTAAMDAWVWENLGHDRTYSLTYWGYTQMMFWDSTSINDPNISDSPEGTYSLSSKKLEPLTDTAGFDEKDSFGYVLIANSESDILAGADLEVDYFVHIIP